jgi:hypothetical protein
MSALSHTAIDATAHKEQLLHILLQLEVPLEVVAFSLPNHLLCYF